MVDVVWRMWMWASTTSDLPAVTAFIIRMCAYVWGTFFSSLSVKFYIMFPNHSDEMVFNECINNEEHDQKKGN
ncbi:unnamed protein product [Haemonchus placei]|uniref:Secreted protein n=1 Tax=Haemonchus placei TaxID=6290 RepID=A0A0N4WNA6_HAEPC|nr:unnamed protein product [Haemonchus placei]